MTDTDTRPAWLKGVQAVGTVVQSFGVSGVPHEYTLVKANLEPALPYTVGCRDGFLFISIDVPEAYRIHILAHEVREEMGLTHVPSENRCLHSFVLEMGDVMKDPSVDVVEYAKYRLLMFDSLVPYYEQRPEHLKARREGFLEAIKRTQKVLRDLLEIADPASN